jgi:cystathionine beta-lyase
MAVYKETISLCSYSVGQWALKDYLPECFEYLKHARDLCRSNMEKIVARLSLHQGVKCPIPSGGIYVFPDFSKFEPSADNLFKSMLDGGVALVPGPFFGQQGAGHARIMFAASPEIIDEALDRMDKVLEKG